LPDVRTAPVPFSTRRHSVQHQSLPQLGRPLPCEQFGRADRAFMEQIPEFLIIGNPAGVEAKLTISLADDAVDALLNPFGEGRCPA
jgi:hypothetical protein